MAGISYRSAFIVGAGGGLSASLARAFYAEGLKVALGARDTDKLGPLRSALGAHTVRCDAAQPDSVATAFADVERALGAPDVVIFNAGRRIQGPFIELDPEDVRSALAVNAFGGFLVAQEAARRMIPERRGAIFFTGASASLKGYAQSAPFAMGKFALRGLAQSMARELSPFGIHVAHFVIDGGIRSAARPGSPDFADSLLDPDAIARTYLEVLRQHRSAWSFEVDLRPWVERF